MTDEPRYGSRPRGGYSVLATHGGGQSADIYRLDRAATPPLRAPVDLAHSPAFAIGAMQVDPQTRQVVHPDKKSETLEPRVMEVLVALRRAAGAIVSRDDLIASCWRGMVVGEDAINRVIHRLRKLADATGAFRIETITRVGYRLHGTDGEIAVGTTRRIPASGRAIGLAAVVLALVIAGFGSYLASRKPAVSAAHHLTLRADQNVGASGRSADFASALKAALIMRDVPVSASADDLILTSSVTEKGAKIVASAVLDDRASGRTLWAASKDFTVASDDTRQAAAWVADMMGCAFGWLKDEPGATASPVMPIVMRDCEVADTPDFQRQLQIGREMIEADRASPMGYSLVAYAAHGMDLAGTGTPASHAQGLAAVAEYRKMRPDRADGLAKQAMLMSPRRAVERERLLRGATDPSLLHCDCSLAFLGDFLLQSGRASEARKMFQRAEAQTSDDQLILYRNFNAADVLGLHGTADQYAAKVLALPGGESQKTHLDVVRGLWRGDRAALRRAAVRASANRDPFAQAIGASLAAIADGDAAKRHSAAQALAAVPFKQSDDNLKVDVFAALGDLDDAFALMEDSRRRGAAYSAPGAYPGLAQPLAWSPVLRKLRRDPRFTGWLERAGFFAYWRATKSRPDECTVGNPPGYCSKI